MTSTALYAIVPAAGIGRRMGGEIPKQYLPLAGKTVIEQTLHKLLAVPGLQKIVVALAADDDYWRSLALANHPQIVTVAGGRERADSVLAGLDYLKGQGASGRVLVHDAARPCVRPGDIAQLLSQAHEDGGILAAPVSDTVKQATPSACIASTLDRQLLWAALTPQLFDLAQLHRAITGALAQGAAITDEASAMEWAGFAPRLVEGQRDNIKITRPEDLPLADMILTRQLSELSV
ncbi:2-C-methyl-D-erythritol 4-phosphate cytidylyltransferase [Gilvimarinus xylanilyticus]|uniref:2-C-methyl-D-erythritol 4-phosphate cytidylyltransferase n=1 Tax=Gilvimarinus xylanilyticus TaxID=2944139 RepID=A0A9X2I288_9GAMM|nr:2-C-methyl-D-erythritol 4-phosphate cytidylyltransferase [Gilvimarinus xylanilyticus]MCP8898985.1 2-C-methyl-D-erythritol 4-phosphate cytidylyltransferase [Gilvimarinus xylanilyticus]